MQILAQFLANGFVPILMWFYLLFSFEKQEFIALSVVPFLTSFSIFFVARSAMSNGQPEQHKIRTTKRPRAHFSGVVPAEGGTLTASKGK